MHAELSEYIETETEKYIFSRAGNAGDMDRQVSASLSQLEQLVHEVHKATICCRYSGHDLNNSFRSYQNITCGNAGNSWVHLATISTSWGAARHLEKSAKATVTPHDDWVTHSKKRTNCPQAEDFRAPEVSLTLGNADLRPTPLPIPEGPGLGPGAGPRV